MSNGLEQLYIHLAAIAVGAIGLLLLALGLRGRFLLTAPACPACHYDLRAANLTTRTVCPECGRCVSADTVSYARRIRRPSLIVAAAIVLLLALAVDLCGSALLANPRLLRIWLGLIDPVAAPGKTIVQTTMDPAFDPGAHGVLKLKRLYTRPQRDGVHLVAQWERPPGSTPWAVAHATTIRHGLEEWPVETLVWSNQPRTHFSSMPSTRPTRPLPPEMRKVDLVLTPDLKAAQFIGMAHVWGGTIILRDVPLERYDLDMPSLSPAPEGK